jgi:hypothetical protein
MILVANLLILLILYTYHAFLSLSLITLLAPPPSEHPPHNSLETRVLVTIK